MIIWKLLCQVIRAKEEAREEVLEMRVKLKEVEVSLESRKEGLDGAEEAWRRRLEEQLDVVEQLEQANFCNFFNFSRKHNFATWEKQASAAWAQTTS